MAPIAAAKDAASCCLAAAAADAISVGKWSIPGETMPASVSQTHCMPNRTAKTKAAKRKKCAMAREMPSVLDRALSQKAHLVALQHQASQSTCRVGAGVDVDAIGANIGFAGRGVAVHHNLAKILFMQKKIFTNPKEVMLGLFLERNAGSHPRVHEKKVTTRKRKRQAFQKTAMAVGHGMTKGGCQPVLRLQIEATRRGYTVRKNGVEAAYILPLG